MLSMDRVFAAFCFLPMTTYMWASFLCNHNRAGWAFLPLMVLTLLLVILRAPEPSICSYALIVQAVIGLFIGIAYFSACHFGGGQLTLCKSNLKNTATALEMYATDNDGRYPGELAALTPNYLKNIPNCPSAQEDTYSFSYLRRGEHFTLYCSGHNHAEANTPANYPQYSSLAGLVER